MTVDDYGRLKHSHPLWSIRRNTFEVPSGPSRTRYHASRGDVQITADTPVQLATMITDEERRQKWDRR